MQLKGKNILITGGAGFIGSHLVDRLVENNKVVVFDDFTSNVVAESHFDRVLLRHIDISFEISEIEKIIHDYQISIVIHLAVKCLRESITNPSIVWDTNSNGTFNLCKICHLFKQIERFVYVSSSEVYGTAKTTPMNEDHPLEPTTVYGASKLAGEAVTRAYHRTYGLPVTIVRPFNTYGPREHLEGYSGEVIPRFVHNAMNGMPLAIYGNGRQTRDFTYVDDVIDGIIGATESDEMIGETVNIASGRETSINDIDWIIHSILIPPEYRHWSKSKYYGEPRPGDVQRHFADISKAYTKFSYQPKVKIKEGIRRYIDWYKDNKSEVVLEERNW